MSSLKQSAFDHSMVKWIGIGLIFSCLVFGFGKWYSYPFSVYPTFDSMVEEEANHLYYVGENESGKTVPLTLTPLYSEYTSPRYWEMEYNIIEERKVNKLDTALLDRFVSIYADHLEELKKVRIYVKRESIVPEKRLANQHFLIYSRECN